MSAIDRIQEMPRSGGYQSLKYNRVPIKPFWKPRTIVMGYILSTTLGFVGFRITNQEIKRTEIENRSSRLAILPFLYAERDRAYLKQLRRNRDDEAELMKNVDGWVVGTWFGEPIYKTFPKDTFHDPHMAEYYVHANDKAFFERTLFEMWA